MKSTTKQQVSKPRPLSEGRGLYDLVVDVSQYALALARTYENRRPQVTRRGRQHAV